MRSLKHFHETSGLGEITFPAVGDKTRSIKLKCPHCGELLGELTCSACNRSLPEKSRYCCWCGEELAGAAEVSEDPELATEDDAEGPIDLASRKLCSDGTCIGVIGPDGRCKECGKPYTGEPEPEPDEEPEEEEPEEEKH
jgi:hypothetical protein